MAIMYPSPLVHRSSIGVHLARLTMPAKRYRTLRLWHNTLLMVWALPFVLLPGIIAGAYSGHFQLLLMLSGLGVVGLVVANIRDRLKKCAYRIEGERLILERNDEQRVLDIEEVADASLIDRAAAREYLREWSSNRTVKAWSRAEHVRQFTNYCTIDIGLRSVTLGMGRTLIDNLPNAKRDLVLLRLKNGEAMLLSPVHSQDMVESIGRRKIGAADH